MGKIDKKTYFNIISNYSFIKIKDRTKKFGGPSVINLGDWKLYHSYIIQKKIANKDDFNRLVKEKITRIAESFTNNSKLKTILEYLNNILNIKDAK